MDIKINQACRKWIDRDFTNIPTQLIIRAYKDNPEDLEILNKNEENIEEIYNCWPSIWGWCFSPNHRLDQDWIRENIEAVEKCGFTIYDSDETGILLAIQGAGYDFFESHWIPLYIARKLEWHLI